MAKKKKTLLGLSFWRWLNIIGVFGGMIGGLIALIVTCVNFLHNQRADTDRKVAAIEQKTESLRITVERIDANMAEMKAEFKKTSDLLNADLSWRYLYQNDPSRKYLTPRYHPDTRTLELVDRRVKRGDSGNP